MQTGDEDGYPSDWPSIPLTAPDDLDTKLTPEEELIVRLHERPRRELSHEERERMEEEMESIRKEMIEIAKEKFEYQRDVNRFVCISNGYSVYSACSLSLSLSCRSFTKCIYMR